MTCAAFRVAIVHAVREYREVGEVVNVFGRRDIHRGGIPYSPRIPIALAVA